MFYVSLLLTTKKLIYKIIKCKNKFNKDEIKITITITDFNKKVTIQVISP